MYFPTIKTGNAVRTVATENFGGLNRSCSCADNEFTDMKNCGLKKYPFISGRESRDVIESFDDEITHVFAPTDLISDDNSFTGYRGGKFYWRGVQKSLGTGYRSRIPYPFNDKNKYPEIDSSDKESVFCTFNDSVYKFPDMSGYNPYTGKTTNTNVSATVSSVTFRIPVDTNDASTELSYFDVPSADYKNIFNYKNVSGTVTAPCKFKVGDRINIYFDSKQFPNNCTVDTASPAVLKAVLDSGYFSSVRNSIICSCYLASVPTYDGRANSYYRFGCKLYDVKGNRVFFSYSGTAAGSESRYSLYSSANVTISKHANELVYATEFAGRIFALDPYGKYIYASKLQDPLNFTTYDGLSDSSWYTEIGSSGEWTGMIANSSYLYCFKKDKVYVLYGDNSKNFTVAKSFSPGCIDGKSITVVNNYIFYMAADGIYCYNSGVPSKVSEKLGDFNYTNGVFKGFGSLLYACVKNDEKSELLIFDTDKNIWMRHDDIDIVGFYEYENKLYGATKHDFICFDKGYEDIEFSITSKLFTDAASFLRSIVSLYFRFNLPTCSDAEVFVSYDGGEWQRCGFVSGGKITGTNESLSVVSTDESLDEGATHAPGVVYSQRVPVRFRASSTYQYKVICHGGAVIEAVERDVYVGGRARR